MRLIIIRSMVAAAQRSNANMPDEERWSRLVKASGRLAKRVTRKGITASELRDERPSRTQDFGSETMRCRRHGSKGSTKTLPGRRKGYGIGVINMNIRLRNSMIAAGLVAVKVIKKSGQVTVAEQVIAKMPVLAEGPPIEIRSFDMLKRMLTGGQQ